jgi:protease I
LATILIPLPSRDFDPTEAGVPWCELTRRGHQVLFATPAGAPAAADPRMVHGTGLGPLRPLLQANQDGIAAYQSMVASPEFRSPVSYLQASGRDFGALLLPGGHAKGMREYLESTAVQGIVTESFERGIPVGAICHGVVAAARSTARTGLSVLHGYRTTALTRDLELSGWALTALWLGNYYRTYRTTVQSEVTAALANPKDFVHGPLAIHRDSPAALHDGFVVQDRNYLSARWPGDAHLFAATFASMLQAGAEKARSSSAA